MPNYRADPDIREVLDASFAIPAELDPAEVGRLQEFLRCDQVLEAFYARSQSSQRPPEADLSAAASAAIAAYDQRSNRLPVGWRTLLVLQAGIAGSEANLDSSEIQDWALHTHQGGKPGLARGLRRGHRPRDATSLADASHRRPGSHGPPANGGAPDTASAHKEALGSR